MIELTATTAAMLYLCLTLSVLFGLWTYHHYRSRHKKITTLDQELLVCEYCHAAYLGDIAKDVSQCPQCSCYNKQNTYRSHQNKGQ